jgi:threonylcarbamoyladenosine tRNA methylthiotransferase MtaB
MPQVARDVVKVRAARLRQAGEAALAGFLQAQVGLAAEILVESNGAGRTPQFAEARLTQPAAVGQIRRGRVTGHDGRRLEVEVAA